MSPNRPGFTAPRTPTVTEHREEFRGSDPAAARSNAGDGHRLSAADRGSHTAITPERMGGDRTPPTSPEPVMSLTDRNLRTSSDEAPQRSRRRWLLPTAAAVVVVAAGAVGAATWLGRDTTVTAAAPTTAAGPSAAEIAQGKDAAWTSVQTWDQRSGEATRVNSFDGIDVASVALPGAIRSMQQFIDNSIATGVHSEGDNKLSLISASYYAENDAAHAPARVQISVCTDTTDAEILDANGKNVRVGPDGSTDFPLRFVVNYWVYETNGKWLSDAGAMTQDPC